MPNGFIFYDTYFEAFSELPDEDRLKVYDALIAYGLFGEERELPAHLKPCLALAKPGIDSARRRYRSRVANGKCGGAPKNNQNAKKDMDGSENQPKTTKQQPKTTKQQPKTTEPEPKNNLNINKNINNNININKNISTNKNTGGASSRGSDVMYFTFPPGTGLIPERPRRAFGETIDGGILYSDRDIDDSFDRERSAESPEVTETDAGQSVPLGTTGSELTASERAETAQSVRRSARKTLPEPYRPPSEAEFDAMRNAAVSKLKTWEG